MAEETISTKRWECGRSIKGKKCPGTFENPIPISGVVCPICRQWMLRPILPESKPKKKANAQSVPRKTRSRNKS